MRVLIENYKYQATDVKDILHGINALEDIEGYVSLNYVGYFYNTELRDCVFILPKVLLETIDNEDKVFGKYLPKDILDIDTNKEITKTEKDFIYEGEFLRLYPKKNGAPFVHLGTPLFLYRVL